jgi:hypothetical protein
MTKKDRSKLLDMLLSHIFIGLTVKVGPRTQSS